jgi:GrpB-like predicted nucleotidyltransferase (UPF0157 family)
MTAMRGFESLEEKVARLVREDVAIVPWDPAWPEAFRREKDYLLSLFPTGTFTRIEHIGSTAVPGLAAKPVIDMLIGVRSLEEAKRTVVPVLERLGYDYLWRPTRGDNVGPWYAWFIKRNAEGARTHHLHLVEEHFEHWERLLFRDYLIGHPDTAEEYGALKLRIAEKFPNDRVAYTEGKSAFIARVMERARATVQP